MNVVLISTVSSGLTYFAASKWIIAVTRSHWNGSRMNFFVHYKRQQKNSRWPKLTTFMYSTLYSSSFILQLPLCIKRKRNSVQKLQNSASVVVPTCIDETDTIVTFATESLKENWMFLQVLLFLQGDIQILLVRKWEVAMRNWQLTFASQIADALGISDFMRAKFRRNTFEFFISFSLCLKYQVWSSWMMYHCLIKPLPSVSNLTQHSEACFLASIQGQFKARIWILNWKK